jgi:hypothetical protein
MSKYILAIHGGTPVISDPMELFKSIGEDEVNVVSEVIRGGVLSAYIGAPGPGFMGGTQVRKFERQAAEYFSVKHAIAVNSRRHKPCGCSSTEGARSAGTGAKGTH